MYTICTYLIYYEGTKAAMEWTLETKHRETEFNSSQTYEIQTADFQVCRNFYATRQRAPPREDVTLCKQDSRRKIKQRLACKCMKLKMAAGNIHIIDW